MVQYVSPGLVLWYIGCAEICTSDCNGQSALPALTYRHVGEPRRLSGGIVTVEHILALQLKPILASEAKKRQGTRTDLVGENIVQNSALSKTRDELAKIAGVSHDTIVRVDPELVGLSR